MNDAEMFALLGGTSKWNVARKIFMARAAKIEQLAMQRTPESPIVLRKMEFEAVREILAVYGVDP